MRDIKRVIIAGSRYITEYALVVRAVERSGLRPEVVLSGTCRGVDKLGERWAEEHDVPIERYPADWNRNPKYAGNQRNTTMVLEADALIAIFEGWGVRIDSGSEDVILKARTHGLEVFEYTPAMLR